MIQEQLQTYAEILEQETEYYLDLVDEWNDYKDT
jgi:hypothetical protein